MSRSHRSEKTAKKLTWEGLRTHEYLKELYDSIPGLKRSPDPYSPDEEGDRSALSEEAISPETQDPLDNIEELKKMDDLFYSLDWKGKLAYGLTLGYGTYPYRKGKYPSADVSPRTSESSRPSTQEGFGAFLPYATAKRYSVSFEGGELSRSEVAEVYIKPIFGRDGVSLEEHAKRVQNPLSSSSFRTLSDKRDVKLRLHELVHMFLSQILYSILDLSVFQDRLASHVFDFLITKEVLSESDLRSDTQSRSAEYSNFGGTPLKTLGLNFRPELVIGVQDRVENGTSYGVIAASLLGEVKFCSLELRANFKNVKRFLDEHNCIFIRAVSAEETPDLEQLAGHTATRERFAGTPEGVNPFRARKCLPSFTDDDIATTGVSRYDFFKAVKLYSIITKLVTTGVHAGVPRVLLMDFNDYLFIDLDRGFIRDAEVRTDQYFLEMVNCRYAMFHRSEEFIKLLILGWSLPTKEYCRDIEQFKKAVQDVSVIELREKLDTLDLGGEPSTERRPTPAQHPKDPSPSYSGSLITVPEEDVEDPEQLSTSLTGGPSSSSQKAKSSQKDSEVNSLKRSSEATKESSENAGEVNISQSHIETLSSSPPSPTDTERKSRKIGRPSQAPKLSISSSTTEYFIYHEWACQYYSCVILAESFEQYVRHREGYNSQTLLVNTNLFLKYVCNANKVFDDPLGKSLLKVYDPYWADDSGADPENAFYRFNPVLCDLCTAELKAYEQLSPLMGEIIPTLYAYGTMLDVSVMVRQIYSRFTGPFLLMEHLKKKEGFELSDVDEEFVRNKIIPAFKRLHGLGVVHNDIKWGNMVVTEDGDFKIIDFSHSVITDDDDKYKTEIENIWSWFKFGDSEESID